jgi:hypothetical protein
LHTLIPINQLFHQASLLQEQMQHWVLLLQQQLPAKTNNRQNDDQQNNNRKLCHLSWTNKENIRVQDVFHWKQHNRIHQLGTQGSQVTIKNSSLRQRSSKLPQ